MQKLWFLWVLSLAAAGMAQSAAPAPVESTAPAPAQAAAPEPSDVPTIRMNVREVVLDVVARDNHNHGIGDLQASDFSVFELEKHGKKTPRTILSMREINQGQVGSTSGIFHISSGSVCALNAISHYELAVSASPEPGFHQVLITTSRPHVKLSFRRRYYVGPSPSDIKSARDAAPDDSMALAQAACYHPLVPVTLALTARPFVTPGKATGYSLVLRPESFSAIGLDGPDSRVQLDFGICAFDATGAIVQYMHSSVDHKLDAAAFTTAQRQGLAHLLQIPGSQPPYLARLVLRDRLTGNMGTVDVARPVSMAEQGDPARKLPRPIGSVRSFGVVTPRENAFCGDVYELSPGAARLPDFWNLEPVGSIYTDMLDVPIQDITAAEGIPGVTRTNTYFAVDYYARFYVSKPGEYHFELESDDGSQLEIDDQLVIDNDEVHPSTSVSGHISLDKGLHSIHVPYFQGPPSSLALMLRVKPPGESMRTFKLSEFQAPQ